MSTYVPDMLDLRKSLDTQIIIDHFAPVSLSDTT